MVNVDDRGEMPPRASQGGATHQSARTSVTTEDVHPSRTYGSRPSTYRWSRSDVGLFVALTFLISWTIWTAPLVLGSFPGAELVGVAGVFGPFLAAAVVTKRRHGRLSELWAGLLHWRVGWRWYLAAIGLPVVGVIAATSLTRLLGGGGGAAPLGWSAFPSVLLFSILLGGGQEEPGWRGLAQRKLQPALGWFRAALIIGAAWALWHLPLFIGEGSTLEQLGLSFWTYTAYVPALSVLLAWMYRVTGGSVLLCAVFHGALNAAAVVGYPFGGTTSEVVLVAVTWAAALIATATLHPSKGVTSLVRPIQVRVI